VLDVRSSAEFDGELGTSRGRSSSRSTSSARGRPKCPRTSLSSWCVRRGKRSGMGTLILEKAGLTRVANVAGGMVGWRELGLPS